MVKKNKGKSRFTYEILKTIRKDMPPATRVINPRKKYDRKDFDWREHIEKGEDE